MLVFLLVFGPELIELWMGEVYVNSALIAIIAIGGAIVGGSRPAFSVLSGLDVHGRSSKYGLTIVALTLGCLAVFVLTGQFSLLVAAILYLLADVVFGLLVVPVALARRLGMSYAKFMFTVTRQALLIALGSYVVLWLFKMISFDQLWMQLVCATSLHGLLVLVLYWKLVLSDEVRRRIVSRLAAAYFN